MKSAQHRRAISSGLHSTCLPSPVHDNNVYILDRENRSLKEKLGRLEKKPPWTEEVGCHNISTPDYFEQLANSFHMTPTSHLVQGVNSSQRITLCSINTCNSVFLNSILKKSKKMCPQLRIPAQNVSKVPQIPVQYWQYFNKAAHTVNTLKTSFVFKEINIQTQ